MPKRNVKGGKGFKKGRKDDSAKELTAKFEGKEPGQQYGRIITVLGNRRFMCFCDDGRERMCKVRGVLCWGPKRQRMEIGDVVLISARSFDGDGSDSDERSAGASESTRVEISDIITKIPQRFWRDIRREEDIHPDFFGGVAPSAFDYDDSKKSSGRRAKDDIFGGDDESDSDDDDDDDDEGAADTIQHKKAPKWSAAAAVKPAVASRDRDDDAGDDLDVDAI